MGAHHNLDDLSPWADKEVTETIDDNVERLYRLEAATIALIAEAWSRGLYPKDEDGQLPKAA